MNHRMQPATRYCLIPFLSVTTLCILYFSFSVVISNTTVICLDNLGNNIIFNTDIDEIAENVVVAYEWTDHFIKYVCF